MAEVLPARDLLYESEERFRLMADSSPVLLWMSREDSLCNFFNQSWLEFSGKTLAQEFGVGWAEGIHPEDFQETMDTYEISFSERKPFEMVYRLQRHDGEFRWILDRGTPRYTKNGQFAGYIGSCVDITERVVATAELEEKNRELEEKNRQLEHFSHFAAHDLREPARRVLTAVQIIREDCKPSGPLKSWLAMIERQAGYLLNIISDLRYLTKIGYQKEPASEDCEITALVKEVADEFIDQIRERNVQVTIEKHPTLSVPKNLLRMLYYNLFSNALKHSDGSVAVRCLFFKGTFEVNNGGSGIDPAKLGDIFQPFYRQSTKKGTGLGLFLCQRIIETLGGEIWAESSDNQVSIKFRLNKKDNA